MDTLSTVDVSVLFYKLDHPRGINGKVQSE